MLISNAPTLKLFTSTFLEQRLHISIKTNIVNSIDDLVEQNVAVKKTQFRL